MDDQWLMQDKHKVVLTFETTDSSKLNDIIRVCLGISGIVDSSVAVVWRVDRSELLDREQDQDVPF